MKKILIILLIPMLSVIAHSATVDSAEIDVRSYRDLASAVSAASSTGKTIVVSNNQVLTGNLTIPASVGVRVIRGGLISFGPYTVTIKGPFDAGLYAVFSGTGNLTFGAASVKEVYPQWWGAKGDGVNDDATAIDFASRSLPSGGAVRIPGGTYILGTLSSDPDAHVSYITPHNNVAIIGSGMDVTILKVKSGENARFRSSNAPNIIATAQKGLLENCRFADFTVDWNGANNLLKAGMLIRNNAAILTINGAKNFIAERITVKETPGNQCIFVKNEKYTTTPGSNVVVKNCIFEDSGSGLSGNYNEDHSSVYLQAENSLVENNEFNSANLVNGAAYELHGSFSKGRNNKGGNYAAGIIFASDVKAIEKISVSGDIYLNCLSSFTISAPTYAVNDVSVCDSAFIQRSGFTFRSVYFFVNGSDIRSCNCLTIKGCTFKGNNYANNRFLQLYKIADLNFIGNSISFFNDALNGFGINSANLDLGDGTAFHTINISNNNFNDVLVPVYINTGLGSHSFIFSGNSMRNSASQSIAAVTVNVTSGVGEISNNTIYNYARVAALSGGNSIKDRQ